MKCCNSRTTCIAYTDIAISGPIPAASWMCQNQPNWTVPSLAGPLKLSLRSGAQFNLPQMPISVQQCQCEVGTPVPLNDPVHLPSLTRTLTERLLARNPQASFGPMQPPRDVFTANPDLTFSLEQVFLYTLPKEREGDKGGEKKFQRVGNIFYTIILKLVNLKHNIVKNIKCMY